MGGETKEATDERRQFGVTSRTPPEGETDAAQKLPQRRAPFAAVTDWVKPPARMKQAFESELDHGNAFLFIPVFLAAGSLLYFSLADEPRFIGLFLIAAAFAGVALTCRSRPALRAALLAGFLTTTGMLAANFETWRADTPMLGSEITTRLTARVAGIEHQISGRVRLTLDVVATERPTLRYGPDRVRATARSVPEGLRPGDTVEGVVRLMPASGPVRPGSYDFAFNSYFGGIGAVGFFLSNPRLTAQQTPLSSSETVWAWFEKWRLDMAARIETTIGGPEGGIAAALITGIRTGIPEDINEALRIVGLYHVISISGLHMALVGGTVMVAMRTAFALAPTFSARRPVKKYAAATALAAAAFYLLMCGGTIAAQRAFIMLGVMLLAVIFDRAALTMRNLAISAIIILLWAPHEVVGPSFQMSFAATAALIAAYSAWTQHRQGRKRAPPVSHGPFVATLRAGAKYAAGLSMTSVVAGIATALYTAWHFQQVAPLGLIANLAAMPFVSVVVMPMAVLATLAMPFGLDGLPLQAMGMGIAAMNAIALWLAERSAFDATGAIPLSAVLALTAALAILTMAGSALRWFAAPLLVAGTILLAMREMPDVLVSEDARLVALRLSDGRVTVNRDRPRAFTMQNWERALDADETVRPRKTENISVLDVAHADAGESAFSCDQTSCVARHHGSGIVVHTQDVSAAAAACSYASLIVIDDATARNPCASAGPLVITKRDLARRGSVGIVFRNGERATIDEAHADPIATRAPKAQAGFAIREPYRPWHHHRQFSREARGLAPYERPTSSPRSEQGASDDG
jgi:ComEC/Rec2-related protein